jgi:hypothetical protein
VVTMTNDELAKALVWADQMLRTSGTAAVYHSIYADHLSALLQEQRRRALARSSEPMSPTMTNRA